MNKRCRFIMGIFFGLIIGLLFAPFKGEEMRYKVKEKYDEFKENPKETAKSNFEILINRLENMTKDLNERLEDIMDDCEFEEVGEDIIIKRTFDDDSNDNASNDGIVLNLKKDEI